MKHLAPIPDSNWPDEVADMLDGFAGRLNVYRAMAHNSKLLRAWAPLRDHVVNENALGRQFSEVVILRTAFRLGSHYEWSHHVCRARACGLDDQRIASLRGPVELIKSTDSVLASAVDELIANGSIGNENIEKIEELFGVNGLLDLIATVGFYKTLGFILTSFSTPLDTEIDNELRNNPLTATATE